MGVAYESKLLSIPLLLGLRTVCHVRDNFSIYQSKIMTICLALLIIVTHPAPSQYSISKCSPFLYSSLVIICTLCCTTINMPLTDLSTLCPVTAV